VAILHEISPTWGRFGRHMAVNLTSKSGKPPVPRARRRDCSDQFFVMATPPEVQSTSFDPSAAAGRQTGQLPPSRRPGLSSYYASGMRVGDSSGAALCPFACKRQMIVTSRSVGRAHSLAHDVPVTKKNRAPSGTRFQLPVWGPAIFQRGTCCTPVILGGYIRRRSHTTMRSARVLDNAKRRMSAMPIRKRVAIFANC
jgi:hypothetical protein